MTAQIPVKAVKSGSTVSALSEFAAGDKVDPSYIDGSGFATAAQGAKADSAVQPPALAVVQSTVPTKDITANYTLSDADAGYRLRVNSAVGVTITDPGTLTPSKIILVQQIGTGQPTISGPNVQSFAATTKLAGQRAMATITVDSSTVTYVNGELAAS